MSGNRLLLALGVCLLLLAVPIAMCVGLSDEPSSHRNAPSPRDDDEAPPEADPDDLEPDEPDPDDLESDEPEPAQGIRTISGHVSGAGDEAVVEAEVMIDGFGRLRDFSDERGDFSLRSVPTEPVTLVVSAAGYRTARVELEQGEPATDERHDVRLEDGSDVAGTVLDPDGRPVRGATVRCAELNGSDVSTTSDRSGRFVLPERAAGCDAIASHDRFSDSPKVALESGPRNLIALAALGSIAGAVVDDGGKPVRSFVVAIESSLDEHGKPGRRSYRQSFNHPQGRFTVSSLPAGRYVLSIRVGSKNPVLTQPIAVRGGEQVRGIRVTAH